MGAMRDRLRGLAAIAGTPPPFDPDAAPEDPLALFLAWFDAAVAASVPEPHAMTLSTVDAAGVPDARVVILKDLEDGAFAFASSIVSAKGAQLVAAQAAALSFAWPQQSRAVRIRGGVAFAEEDERRADFRRRSPSARALVLAAPQSGPLLGDLDAALAAASAGIEADPDLVAEDWRVWRLRPTSIEFWQGSADRRHLRLQYRCEAGRWVRRRLQP